MTTFDIRMRHPILAALLLLSVAIYGQQIPAQTDEGSTLNVLYRNEASGRIFASTRGFGISFRQAKHLSLKPRTYAQKPRTYYELELQSLRHPKETKSVGEGAHKRRFVYGKVNNVMLMRGAIGYQDALFSKGDLKAVEVRYSYSLGPTLAVLKPYYVKVYHSTPGALSDDIDVKFDSKEFRPDSGRIPGRSDFATGLTELAVLPGATAKFNLTFEYAPYTNLVRALETGISVDYFPKAVALLARNPSENVIVTIHLGFVFGRKWF